MNKIKEFLADVKNSWRSWVIWFNSAAAAFVLFLPDLQASFPQLQGYIPDHFYKWGMGILIAGNIALRFKTSMSLADKGKK